MSDHGQDLRELRRRAGLTQQQVGDALGVTKAQVSRIERGENTTVDRLQQLCELYGVRGEFVIIERDATLNELSEAHQQAMSVVLRGFPKLSERDALILARQVEMMTATDEG